MSKRKKKLFIVAAMIVAAVCALAIYSASQKPSIVPKLGTYSCSSGASYENSLTGPVSEITLDAEGRCSLDYDVPEKHYAMEHSLLHGDVVVVDWLKNKKLKFKVTSDTTIVVLEDCGIFEKGQTYKLIEEI